MKKVRLYGNHSKKTLFVGSQEECEKYIFDHANEENKMADGRLIYREIHDPDGIAYDIGYSYLYQIVEADGNETEGIDQNYIK